MPPVTSTTRCWLICVLLDCSTNVSRVQARSTASATPMPPPMHSAARPFFASRRCISCSSVTRMRQPDAPIGWPMAIAPPLTLTFAGVPAHLLVDGAGLRGEGFVDLHQVEVAAPSSRRVLQRLAATAGTGPMPMIAGSRPAVRVGLDARQRLSGRARLAFLARHHHHGGGAVVQARGVAGRHRCRPCRRRGAGRPALRRWSSC